MNQSLITWIFRANIFFLALLLPILFGFSLDSESRLFRLSISTLLLAVIFFLPAINTTAILAKLSGKFSDAVEFLSVALVSSLLLVPFLLSIESEVFHTLSPQLPLINSVASFILFLFFFQSTKNTLQPEPLPLTLESDETYPFWKAFIVAFLIIAATIFGITTSYYALPDLDPYYWITVFQDQFTRGVISSITSYRPLFSSLAYLFNQSAGVDLYAFFKYLIPFFALTPLVPAILVARRFSRLIPQLAILLIPIVNASFFLYSTHPIPQSIFNSLVVSVIFLVLHSLFSGKKIYFFLAGVMLFLGFFYHEMAAIPFLAWLLSWLFFERKQILRLARENKAVAALVLLLLVSNISLFTPLFSFASSWGTKIATLIAVSQTNFAFPAHYINIDGNSVGWQGMTGVIQYYAYYFGPAALILMLCSILILRSSLTRPLLKRPESVFLSLSLFLFLLMSDILPRLFNIALLPERALGFSSLFLLAFIPLLFLSLRNKTDLLFRLIPLGLLIAFFINIGAALYINNLKQYLITPAQITSAEWIRSNLPEHRVIFSTDNHKLLTFYASSTVASIADSQFYSDADIIEKHLRGYTPNNDHETNSIRKQLENISDVLADLSNTPDFISADFLRHLRNESEQLNSIQIVVEEALRTAQNTQGIQPKYYIYYAAPSAKNPYAHRPYMPQSDTEQAPFIFERYPERFRMIYSDTEHDIYLWEVL